MPTPVTRIVFGARHAGDCGRGWRLARGWRCDDDFEREMRVHESIAILMKSMIVERGIARMDTAMSERFWRTCNRVGDFAVSGIFSFSLESIPTLSMRDNEHGGMKAWKFWRRGGKFTQTQGTHDGFGETACPW